jgi:hypothetical protein
MRRTSALGIVSGMVETYYSGLAANMPFHTFFLRSNCGHISSLLAIKNSLCVPLILDRESVKLPALPRLAYYYLAV